MLARTVLVLSALVAPCAARVGAASAPGAAPRAAGGPLPVPAHSPLRVGVSLDAPAPLSPAFWGYNNGEKETTGVSLSDPAYQAAQAKQGLSSYRYPAGTAAQYWDWPNGCEFGDTKHCGTVNNTVQALASFVAATGVKPTVVVNMLTDPKGLPSQLAFLAAIEAAGVAINAIELGNEFFNAHPDFIKAFPTGADYGKLAATWAAAFAAAHPAAALIAVGQPSVLGNNARKGAWNADMVPHLPPSVTGLTMHEYHATGLPKGRGTFTQKDVAVALGAPFATVATIVDAIAGHVPPRFDVWMTEFNLKEDVAAGVAGSWAHGLYVATEALLAANATRTRISHVNLHCAVGYADDGALFAVTDAFAFGSLSPNQNLPTALFGRSAEGYTTALLGAGSRGATAAAGMAFSPNPTIDGGVNGKYPTLLGVAFSGGPAGASAVVVNLGAAAVSVPAAGYKAYASATADPTAPVNAPAKVTEAKGAVAGGAAPLPAYGILLLTQ